MTDLNKTLREMDGFAHEIIRLRLIGKLARISHCRIMNEMLKQAHIFLNWQWHLYAVGSTQEGFPYSAIDDIDLMICNLAFPIIMWKFQEKEMSTHVMAEQDSKHPVYLRLKVFDKTCLDEDFQSVINKDGYLKTSNFMKIYSNNPFYNVKDYVKVRKGPSITEMSISKFVDVKTCPTDSVLCLKCQSWPPFTCNFFTRERLNNWPSQKLLDKVRGLECHVVPVGYPGSESFDIEWRLSFSIAERELITEMHEPYHECMFALKSIKKKYLYSDSDKPTLFCSYFLKTACLWMCETFPHIDYSVMDLITKVLEWLVDCYQHKHLPHYFIPQHNLIGHLSREYCDNVRETLTEIKRNLWTKVLSVCYDDYSTLETLLLNNHPAEAIALLQDKCLNLCTEYCLTVNSEMTKLAIYNPAVFTDHLLERVQWNPFHAFSVPEKIILPIVKNIEEIVPKGYGEMFKTSLYRYLGDIYTHLLVYLRNTGRIMYDVAVAVNQNSPLHYYKLGTKMIFPDNCSDHSIGGQVLVVKYHYIMGNYKELKQMCDSILYDFCRIEKNCRLAALMIVQIDSLYTLASLFSGWAVDDILLYLVRCSRKLNLYCHPIILVLYIKARVLLTEGDTENALNLVKKMKERTGIIKDPEYESTTMFIKIIESLGGLLVVMRIIFMNCRDKMSLVGKK
ncbi:uncharacterized protein LOC117118042 [Anneissia japonica]|uniref:uncharacterized protein LOC117118042 n=1 Tax=Anneissia japonica TaxID=1529436 RepID=UPI0014257CED|nr:uncharacterized protein LOC117118042 [Anneissia japonica]